MSPNICRKGRFIQIRRLILSIFSKSTEFSKPAMETDEYYYKYAHKYTQMLPSHSGNVYVLMINKCKASLHSIGLFKLLKWGICKFARSSLQCACARTCARVRMGIKSAVWLVVLFYVDSFTQHLTFEKHVAQSPGSSDSSNPLSATWKNPTLLLNIWSSCAGFFFVATPSLYSVNTTAEVPVRCRLYGWQ